MIMLAMMFYPHEKVFADTPVELIGLIAIIITVATILSSAVTWYRHSRCSNTECRNFLGLHRHGKYLHGHLKLCHVHHPLVPNNGKINQVYIDEITKNSDTKV